ncbi:hypothetical protein Drorol1_Dr00016695 [Drosera rotundifolia]
MESLLHQATTCSISSPPLFVSTPRSSILSPTANPCRRRSRFALQRILSSPFVASTYKSDFRDFQDYAKPTRLLPAEEVKLWSDSLLKESLDQSVEGGFESRSLYKVQLRTSPIYGSGQTDTDAGILVCIIDENGDSILQRLPSVSYQGEDMALEEVRTSEVLHFQNGSVDEFAFQGPRLGPIRALWVGVESGKWRLGGLNLVVVSSRNAPTGQSDEIGDPYASLQYDFEVQDLLLGDDSDLLMSELRPSKVTEYSGADPVLLLRQGSTTQSLSLATDRTTNEESMKEYANLKLSLLVYNAMLVLAGTTIASFAAGESTALAFLAGGAGGFLYLLLLQRYVDRLPAPDVATANEGASPSGLFAGVNAPLLILVSASASAVIVAKRGSADVFTVLTPQEIVAGLAGFLACKGAVLLAAFKPLSIGTKDGE